MSRLNSKGYVETRAGKKIPYKTKYMIKSGSTQGYINIGKVYFPLNMIGKKGSFKFIPEEEE